MDICKAQNKINDLLQDIFNEYNRMNETKIQSKCEIDLEMRTMISTIRSLEEVTVEKDGEIRALKKTVHEYEVMINDLQEKLVVADEEEKETNKFDMLRMQSKELVLKDREIDRLNGLLNHFKNKSKEDKKIESVLTQVEEKVESEEVVVEEINNDEDNLRLEISTENSNNDNSSVKEVKEVKEPPMNESEVKEEGYVIKAPLQKFLLGIPVEHLEQLASDTHEISPRPGSDSDSDPDTNNEVKEPDPEPIQETVTGDDTEAEEREKVEKVKADTEKMLKDKTELGKLLIVTSKKVKYFVYENENPQKLYEFNKHKHAQKVVGTRTKNDKGKYKVQLLTP